MDSVWMGWPGGRNGFALKKTNAILINAGLTVLASSGFLLFLTGAYGLSFLMSAASIISASAILFAFLFIGSPSNKTSVFTPYGILISYFFSAVQFLMHTITA